MVTPSYFLINKIIFKKKKKNRARHRVGNAWAEMRDPQYVIKFQWWWSRMVVNLVATMVREVAGVLDRGIGDGNDNAYLIPHKRGLEISQITLI